MVLVTPRRILCRSCSAVTPLQKQMHGLPSLMLCRLRHVLQKLVRPPSNPFISKLSTGRGKSNSYLVAVTFSFSKVSLARRTTYMLPANVFLPRPHHCVGWGLTTPGRCYLCEECQKHVTFFINQKPSLLPRKERLLHNTFLTPLCSE